MTILKYQRINRALKPNPGSTGNPVSSSSTSYTITHDNTVYRRAEAPWSVKGVPINTGQSIFAGFTHVGNSSTTAVKYVPAEEGKTYTASVYWMSNVVGTRPQQSVTYWNEALVNIVPSSTQTTQNPLLPTMVWNRASYTFTVPTGLGITRMRQAITFSMPSGQTTLGTEQAWITDFLIEDGDQLGSFFDGSTDLAPLTNLIITPNPTSLTSYWSIVSRVTASFDAATQSTVGTINDATLAGGAQRIQLGAPTSPTSNFIPVTPGLPYSGALEVMTDSGNPMYCWFQFYDSTNTLITTPQATYNGVAQSAPDFTRVTVENIIAPAGATHASLLWGISGAGARSIGQVIKGRKALVVQDTFVPVYFDGSSIDGANLYTWASTIQASFSTRTGKAVKNVWSGTANDSFSVQFVSVSVTITPQSYQLFDTQMRWRYIAQNILTGAFTDWDVPLKRDELTWELSGPGALRGTIDPQYLASGVLAEWQTAIYAEANGQIRWGGILQNVSFNGAAMSLEVAGFSSYANKIPYLGTYYKQIGVNPLTVFSMLWSYMQVQPDGNLGLAVATSGSPATLLGTTTEPYELKPEEATDIGGELTNLAQETPFDYFEEHYWSSDTTVGHRLTAAYPRVGRKRDDLLFSQDSNIISVVPVARDGDSYANIIYGMGKGVGDKMIKAEVAQRDGRLRRPYVFTDKNTSTSARLTTQLRRQYAGRQLVPAVATITVQNHPNARIGSWQVGDDILVQAALPWLGDITVWSRVVSWSLLSETTATLALVRSDSFNYGG